MRSLPEVSVCFCLCFMGHTGSILAYVTCRGKHEGCLRFSMFVVGKYCVQLKIRGFYGSVIEAWLASHCPESLDHVSLFLHFTLCL